MKTLKVGLIKGRHELPVERYIIENEIEDPLDFETINEWVSQFFEVYCGIRVESGTCINQTDYTDVQKLGSDIRLEVYVTGLTAVTAEVIKLCAFNGVGLTLMHYDRDSSTYKAQEIF